MRKTDTKANMSVPMNQRAWILCTLKGTVENNTWLKSQPRQINSDICIQKLHFNSCGHHTARFSWGKIKIHIMAPKDRASFLDAKTGRGIYIPDSSLHWNNETKCDN